MNVMFNARFRETDEQFNRRLAARIADYWKPTGRFIEFHISSGYEIINGHTETLYVVRSDMVGGKPR